MGIQLIVDTAVIVPVNVVPLIDDTDFKTVEDAIAYNAAGMDLRWNFVTTTGVQTSTAVTPTTAGTYDWTHLGDGIYSLEIPASGGASINNDTEGYGWFSGKITGVLPFAGPIITFAPANVVNSLVAGSANLKTDLETIKTQAVTCSGGVTIPAATLASTTNITAAAGCAVSSLGTGVITDTSIAANAITDAKVASDVTIASVTGSVGSVVGDVGGNVSGNVLGSVAGSVASVTAGVTLADVAHGGSTATLTLKSIAVSNSAGNAVTFSSTGANGHGMYVTGNGSGDGVHWIGGATGYGLNAQGGATTGDGIHAAAQTIGDGIDASGAGGGVDVRGNITGSLSGAVGSVAGNVGGNVVGSVDSVVSGVTLADDSITAAKIAADAGTEIATAVWASGTRTLSSFGTLIADIWAYATASIATAGSIGKLIVDNLNAAITSRMASYTQPTGFLAATFPGTVASSSEVTAIQNNTRTVIVVPEIIERPDSGTDTYLVHLYLYDETGAMEAPDSAPTVALTNSAGIDRSARLGSTIGTLVGTGHYKWAYTNTSTDTLEQLLWEFSVTEGGATRLFGRNSILVDAVAVDFTSADRTVLNAAATAAALATAQSAITALGSPMQAGSTVVLTDGSLTTAKLGTFALAKTTNITGFNDLSAAAVNAECDTALADYDAPTNTEMVAAFTEIKGAGFNTLTDTLEAIRDRGDVAWITATGFSTHAAADVWSVTTRILTAGTNIALVKGIGITGFNDLSAAQVNAECDTAIADSGLTTAAIADAVWDEILSEHTIVGSAGATHIAAGSSGDPWSTVVPGSYASGTAGYKIGNLPSASAIATTVDTTLSASHGNTAWGAATIYVTPVASTVSIGGVSPWASAIIVYKRGPFGPFTIAVSDANGTAIDCTGKTLVFTAQLRHQPDTRFTLTSAAGKLTISTSNVTVSDGTTNTQIAGVYDCSIRDTADNNRVLAWGEVNVVELPQDV